MLAWTLINAQIQLLPEPSCLDLSTDPTVNEREAGELGVTRRAERHGPALLAFRAPGTSQRPGKHVPARLTRQLLADHAPEAYGGLTVPQLLDGLRAAFPGHQVLTDLERGEGADALEDEFPQMVAGLFGFRVQFLQHLTLPVGDGTQTGWVPGLVYGGTGLLLLIGDLPGHYIPLFVIDEDARTLVHPAAIGAPAAACDQHAESARGRADHTADAEQLIQRWQRIVYEHGLGGCGR